MATQTDIKNMNPATRRAVIQYAAAEKLTFAQAMECLVLEGIKAVHKDHPQKKHCG